jgi:hypothetical protein
VAVAVTDVAAAGRPAIISDRSDSKPKYCVPATSCDAVTENSYRVPLVNPVIVSDIEDERDEFTNVVESGTVPPSAYTLIR